MRTRVAALAAGLVAGGQPITFHGYHARETAGTTNLTLLFFTGANIANQDNSTYNIDVSGQSTIKTGFTAPTSGGTEIFGEVVVKSTISAGGQGWPAHGLYLPYGLYVTVAGSTTFTGSIWYS